MCTNNLLFKLVACVTAEREEVRTNQQCQQRWGGAGPVVVTGGLSITLPALH